MARYLAFGGTITQFVHLTTTMTTQNLLVELFVEELPPKALKKLGEVFATHLCDQLKVQGLAAVLFDQPV